MEEYTVNKKGTDEIYYVIQMAESQQEIVLLASYATGEFVLLNIQEFVTSYEFNELIEDMDEDSEEEDETESEEVPFSTEPENRFTQK